jgi:glucose/arabinose dehydrogenase
MRSDKCGTGALLKGRLSVSRHLFIGAAIACIVIGPGFAAETSSTRLLTGQEAFGGWQQDAPGVRRLITPTDLPSPSPSTSAENSPEVVSKPADAELKVPAGFSVEQIASGFEAPRIIRRAPNGDLFVVDSAANQVRVLRMEGGSGEIAEDTVFAEGLNQPYGMAFYPSGDNPEWLYVANTDSVVRYPYQGGDLQATGEPETVVEVLPAGHHWTRDIAFSEDGATMWISVGSASNVAEQVAFPPKGGVETFIANHPLGEMWGTEENRAMVLAFDPDGTDQRTFATGLRNCSGMTLQPGTGDLWCVVNERDGLGDNVPAEYATVVEEGAFYGWPWYYIGDNEDPREHLKGKRPDLADKVTEPDILIQAHSAPLGITFYDGDMFPADYRGDAFVALHGSWNRGKRTGYKIVRMLFDDSGRPTGEYEDFLTGFVHSAEEVWGRPVGVAVGEDGALYLSEDGNGTIWRVSHGQGET